VTGPVRVAAAVVLRADGAVLLAQRPAGKVYAGYWEFPGGKLEPGESAGDALARELDEELGLRVRCAAPWLTQSFVYPHATVEIEFFRVFAWEGEPVGRDGQAFAWQHPDAIGVAPLLPANTRVMAALQLPPVYAITCADELGADAMLVRARRAFERGLRLVQLREKTWDVAQRAALARELVPLAHRHGARVLLNGAEDEARAVGADGVHWTSAVLMRAERRPPDLVVAASCHTRAELDRAAALEADFAVLGPVLPTPSHPDATPLGWDAFARIVAGTRIPVYALGGLTAGDLDTAIAHGAHGVALRSAAWPAV
jgi:8-oxo-dGTP diphosphatase